MIFHEKIKLTERDLSELQCTILSVIQSTWIHWIMFWILFVFLLLCERCKVRITNLVILVIHTIISPMLGNRWGIIDGERTYSYEIINAINQLWGFITIQQNICDQLRHNHLFYTYSKCSFVVQDCPHQWGRSALVTCFFLFSRAFTPLV